MFKEFFHVFNKAIKSANFIKANAFNSRLFAELRKKAILCSKIFCCIEVSVRWLSKRNVLETLFLLRKKIHRFLSKMKPEKRKNISGDRFLMFLWFFGRIFELFLTRSTWLQNKVNVLHWHKTLKAFNMKLSL